MQLLQQFQGQSCLARLTEALPNSALRSPEPGRWTLQNSPEFLDETAKCLGD